MGDATKSLIDQVKSALDSNQPLAIEGGGGKRFYGREPVGRPLRISEHTGVVAYEPGELVMTVRAGTRLAEVEAALAEKGQVLPFEPPDHGRRATIGGVLACNLSGPARPWAGSGRDMVLGVKLIDGKGDLLSFGGQVMKNVAGYDVSRFQCGGLGCFGVITQASIKVLPRKPAERCLAAHLADADTAIAAMNAIAGRSLPITGAAWVDGLLHVRLQGGDAAVASGASDLRRASPGLDFKDEAPEFWTLLRHQALNFFDGEEPIWRFAVRSTAKHFYPDAPWLIDWAGGQRWLKGTYRQAQLVDTARAAGGAVCCFRNGRNLVDIFQPPDDVTFRVLSNLKAVFDPSGLFNPGRLYSWL